MSEQAEEHRSLVTLHVAVRDINDRYRDRLASSLPHEIGREFKAAAMERGYPRIFRELPAMRAYRQALEMEEIDEETRAAVVDLHTIFEAELDVLNSRMLSALREFEPRQRRNEVDLYVARQRGERAERISDPMRDQLRHRNERADYYVSLLRDLLGDEQFAQLPAGSRLVDDETRRRAAAEARDRIRQRREQAEQRPDGVRGERGQPQRQQRRDQGERQREQRDRRRGGDGATGTTGGR